MEQMDQLDEMDEIEELKALAARLPEATGRLEELLTEWSERRFTGKADNGRIVAKVDAVGTLLSLDIDPLSKRRLDRVSLGQAVVAAVVAAEDAAAAGKEEAMRSVRLTDDGPSAYDLLAHAQRDFAERTGFRF